MSSSSYLLPEVPEDPTHLTHPLRHLQVYGTPVAECLDATHFFGTRRTNGTNLLQEFYDCTCTGDFTKDFTLTCRLENYCFTPWQEENASPATTADDTTTTTTGNTDAADADTICVNWRTMVDFEVQDGRISTVTRDEYCIEYLSNGPISGRGGPVGAEFCWTGGAACGLQLRDIHGFSSEESNVICQNETMCPEVLPTLNYTAAQVQNLCMYRTLGGVKCRSQPNSLSNCTRRTTDGILYLSTYDCSDVEPCLQSSCLQRPFIYTKPGQNMPYYYNCPTTTAPSANPTTANPATGSPSSASLTFSEPTRMIWLLWGLSIVAQWIL